MFIIPWWWELTALLANAPLMKARFTIETYAFKINFGSFETNEVVLALFGWGGRDRTYE